MQTVWPLAAKAPSPGETVCLMLLGSGLAAARDLAATVWQLRRKSRGTAPLLVAVDIRDWQALLPPETPPQVRSLLDRIRRSD